MNNQMLVLIAGIVGAFIGAGSSIVTTLIAKRFEERRHYRELVIQTAIEHWKQFVALTPPGETIEPLEDFILHMMKVYDLILSKKLSQTQTQERLNEITAQSLELYEFRTRQ